MKRSVFVKYFKVKYILQFNTLDMLSNFNLSKTYLHFLQLGKDVLEINNRQFIIFVEYIAGFIQLFTQISDYTIFIDSFYNTVEH